MRYKKLLLVTFLLALFVFQQVQQAGAIMSSVAQYSSPTDNFQNYTQPGQMNVKMWRLNGNGTRQEPYTECVTPGLDNSHGCVENPSNNPNLILYYPYNTNPALVDVENDYLLDVVAREMPATLYPNLPALTAQAIAARSFANYKYETSDPNFKIIANDGYRYQTFVPYAFDAFLGINIFPTNVNSCDNNLNSLQQKVCDAVTSTAGEYLAPHNSDQPAFTEFSADWGVHTVHGDTDYLKDIDDPISTCGVDTDGSHGRGLNQKGANRWALGNKCATASDGNEPWPVKWNDYRQILAHYYTGIDILDAGGNKKAPDDRWNLLNHTVPSNMLKGDTPTVTFTLQNTSTTAWTNAILGWQWVPSCGAVNTTDWQSDSTHPLPTTVIPGQTIEQQVTITAPPNDGVYILHVDIMRPGGGWFQLRIPGWPDAEIPVQVGSSIPDLTGAPAGFYPYGLLGCYYNDMSLPVLPGDPINWNTFSLFVIAVPNKEINFTAHSKSPIPGSGVQATVWSARWIGKLNVVEDGYYTFSLDGLDDGARLWVDHIADEDPRIIESWLVQGPTTHSNQQPVHLTVGLHDFRLDYVQGPPLESQLNLKWGTNPAALETIHASLTPPTTTVIISGNAGVGGATLFYMDGTPKMAIADSAGNYSFPVSFNWSGTVTPFVAGHSFTPASKSYTYVIADQTTVTSDYTIVDVPTPVVTKLGDSDDDVCDTDCSLREAIASAEPGATVTFAPTLSGIIQLNSALGPLTLSKNVAIDGSALAVPITIRGNNSTAVFTISSGVTAILNSLTITNGKPGINNAGGILLVMNSTFSGNSGLRGGGINNGPSGKLLVTNSTFSNNSAVRGGAIHDDYSSSTVANSTFSNNTAYYGGAIFNDNASSSVTNSTFSVNTDGGIYNWASTLTVTNSTFSGNAGSGIENSNSTLMVMGATFSDNHGSLGGGIENAGNDSDVTVTNSTFSNNSVSMLGGGIYNASGSKLMITNSTFFGNSAVSGGGDIRNSGTATLRNTIVANSATGGNCSGAITNGGNNIDDGTTCGWGSASGSMSNMNPLLAPLANNGGSTQTFGLLASSPARDAGNDTICATAPVNGVDQRGVIRPQGAQCDIGAYELVDTIAPTVVFITRASSNPTNAASVEFTVTFSESVTGVDANDFILTTTGISNAAITSISGSGNTYTVIVSTGRWSGTIRLDVVNNGTIVDAVSNPLSGGFNSGETYTIDKTEPMVISITRRSANPTSAATVEFRVIFSEAVTGVDVSDFTLATTGVSGATVTSVSGSGSSYLVTVNTGSGDGTIRLDVLNATATITDLASNELVRWFTDGEIYTVTKSTSTSH